MLVKEWNLPQLKLEFLYSMDMNYKILPAKDTWND